MIQLGLKAPKQAKKEVVEKYNYPVVTLLPTDGEKSHMINFNKACIEQMGLNETTMVVFGKMGDQTFFIDGQSLGKEHDSIKRKFYKTTGCIMSKFDYEEILKSNTKLGLDDLTELKVTVEYSEELELNIGKMSCIKDVEADEGDGCEYKVAEVTEEEAMDMAKTAIEVLEQ